jgi:hypothetical protein
VTCGAICAHPGRVHPATKSTASRNTVIIRRIVALSFFVTTVREIKTAGRIVTLGGSVKIGADLAGGGGVPEFLVLAKEVSREAKEFRKSGHFRRQPNRREPNHEEG